MSKHIDFLESILTDIETDVSILREMDFSAILRASESELVELTKAISARVDVIARSYTSLDRKSTNLKWWQFRRSLQLKVLKRLCNKLAKQYDMICVLVIARKTNLQEPIQ